MTKPDQDVFEPYLGDDRPWLSDYHVIYVEVERLRPHEEVRETRVQEMCQKIRKRRWFHKPLLVDARTLTVLDGHHKLTAAKRLGLRLVPALLVDYPADARIQVSGWPDGPVADITKADVLEHGASGSLYPPKASRHTYPEPIPKVMVPLSLLR